MDSLNSLTGCALDVSVWYLMLDLLPSLLLLTTPSIRFILAVLNADLSVNVGRLIISFLVNRSLHDLFPYLIVVDGCEDGGQLVWAELSKHLLLLFHILAVFVQSVLLHCMSLLVLKLLGDVVCARLNRRQSLLVRDLDNLVMHSKLWLSCQLQVLCRSVICNHHFSLVLFSCPRISFTFTAKAGSLGTQSWLLVTLILSCGWRLV